MSQRLRMLASLITKGSQDPFVFYARAMELRGLGRLDEAMDAFRKLRASHPDYVASYLMAGQLAVELGDTALAREFFEQGERLARSSGDDHAQSELARALAGLA
jgi:tetratricopeptide (TPR) repeat protein